MPLGVTFRAAAAMSLVSVAFVPAPRGGPDEERSDA